MSVKNYRFVSPGVFVNEIDNSQLPASPAGIGPVIIGRAEKGPALRPTTVNSFEEFVNVFGTPDPGNSGGDVWRQGANTTATTYGAYAAQAYLRNSSPLTFIRLLGAEDDSVVAGSGVGEAGWNAGASGEAYGLVVFQTGSNQVLTGALGAIFYCESGTTMELSGNIAVAFGGTFTPGVSTNVTGGFAASASPMTGSGLVIHSLNSAAKEFKAVIKNGVGANDVLDTITFNFNQNDSKYIRKVFNTNPQLLNDSVTNTNNQTSYFLGETFDRHIDATLTDPDSGLLAAFVKIDNQTSKGDDFTYELQAAETPQIISCKLSPSSVPTDLFKFVARGEPGDWTNKNLKISIQDIKRSTNDQDPYGSFSVVVRLLSDSDNVVQVVEQFNNCNLNPNSLDYIARKIGDLRDTWSATERRYIKVGNYSNNSSYIYVDVNSDIDAGVTAPQLLPFGFKGINKYEDFEAATTPAGGQLSWLTGSLATGQAGTLPAGTYTMSSVFVISSSAAGPNTPLAQTSSVTFPQPVLRVSAFDGNLANPTEAYFGMQTGESLTSTVFSPSYIDILRPRGGAVGFDIPTSGSLSPTFTLDDISGSGVYVTGSGAITVAASGSLTAVNGAVSGVLDAGYDRFTVPLFGGFDGLDIKQIDPFTAASFAMGSTPTEANSYSFFTVKRAIDSIADPEVIEMNLASIPGQTQEGLTTHLVRTCEDRGDALAVIDLPDAFIPREAGTEVNRNNTASTVTTLINGLRSRGLNSSYGCAYYPWVRARDTINGAFLWLPPSVAAIGTFSSSQRKTQVWFAPAGFNRGGLTEGSAGIPVVDVAHQLRRKDRDDLYGANINPIAKFPSEGVVIFGQKTLQVTPSALDRINVRRLMIFVKKRISQIASGLLFDPNIKTTWARFTSRVEPFLADVKTNFGLSDYRVVLDETTTTPDLVDRNILYAQIFLKPTRAIEFIAIDFNITRTGASFDD